MSLQALVTKENNLMTLIKSNFFKSYETCSELELQSMIKFNLVIPQGLYSLLSTKQAICIILLPLEWPTMVVRVVEFSSGGRFLHKNQHTQRKLLNFEFWINGELSKIGHHFSNKKF